MPKPKLLAFIVTCAGEAERGAELVYAQTSSQARQLAHDLFDVSYIEVNARREKKYDARAKQFKKPGVEGSSKYLRVVGWQQEGEQHCGGCGLAPMGLEEFAVCEQSMMCKACGCPPSCEHKGGFEYGPTY